QDALGIAQYGDEIWVAKGIYRPTVFNRSISFEIGNGVSLYGGFSGIETSLDQRDWISNETVLSGDIGMLGDSTDNSYNIVYMEDVDTATVLDGFVVEKGNASTIGGGAFMGRTK